MSESTALKEQVFTELFHATAEKYWATREKSSDLIDVKGKAFLSSIGYTEQEFFDFIEDFLIIGGDLTAWAAGQAEKGDVGAQSSLGYVYLNGFGVDQDYAKAAVWYRKAAENGAASSQSSLGYLYANGFGVDQDFAQSAFWYLKAAEQGADFSQLNYAYQCLRGEGVARDAEQALYWFGKAAAQGNVQAQEELKNLGHPFSPPKVEGKK